MKEQRVLAPSPRLISLAVASCFVAEFAVANPTGPAVVSGTATFNTLGSTFTVTNSPNAIINWRGFSIGAGELTRFQQQSASSAVLNRIVGQDPSAILGTLWSNGRVFLINPNGILFGQGSRVDVAGLVASTLNLSDANFLAGRLNFQAGTVANPIVNQGEIASAAGGRIYLIAPDVQNHGLITSPSGEIVLAAGRTVKLVDADVPNLQVEIQAAGEALNVGQIIAQGGRAGVYAGLINQRGIVRADSVSRDATGRIVFRASDTTILDAGSVTSAAGAKGGEIHVLGDKVGLVGDARVDASGDAGGGTVLIGGDYQGRNPAVPNALRTYFGPDATVSADAITSGDGGKVILWSDDATRAYGTISAKGGAQSGNGGFVEVSSAKWLAFDARVTTLAPNGKTGTLLLDPSNIYIADTQLNATNAGMSGSDPSADSSGPTSFAASGAVADSLLTTGTLVSALSSNNVDVSTDNSSGTGVGNITVVNAVSYAPSSLGNLRLLANNNITVNAAITNSGTSGTIEMYAGWNGSFASPASTVPGVLSINADIKAPGAISLNAGSDIVIGNAADILIQSAPSSGNASVALNAGGSITRLLGDGTKTTTITAQAPTDGAGSSAQVSLTADSSITLNKTNINAIGGGGSSSSAGGGGAQVSLLSLNGNISLNQVAITATAGLGGFANPGGTASVTLDADNGSLTVAAGSVTATGGDGDSGGAATVALTAKNNITIDASAISAAGGLTTSGGFSPDALVSLTTTGTGLIEVKNASNLQATGGDTQQSTGAGTGTVSVDGFDSVTISDSTLSAQGGNTFFTTAANGADASVSVTSGGTLTITGSTTSIAATGGAGANVSAPGTAGAGGSASVTLSGSSGTFITDASIAASGGAGGIGGDSPISTIDGGSGGAGGAASVSITAGSGSQLALTSTTIQANGGAGGAGGNNSFSGGLGGDGGAGGAASISVSSDSHAALSGATVTSTGGAGGAEGIGFSGFGSPGAAGAGSVSVTSTSGNVTADGGSTLTSISSGDATTTLDAGATLTVQGSGTQVKADASAGVNGTVTLRGTTQVKVLSSSLVEAKGGTLASVEINPLADGADVTITDSTISAIGSSGGSNGGSAKVTIKGTGTLAVANSTIGAQGGSGDGNGGNATLDVSAGSGVSLGGGSFTAAVGSGGGAAAIVYVNASSGNIVSSADITTDGPSGTVVTGEETFTGSIRLRALSGFIHDGTAGVAAGGILKVLNASPGSISLAASDGIGQIGNPIRIFDGTPTTLLSNTGAAGDVSISQVSGNLSIASLANTHNANASGTYAYTAESGDLGLDTAFLPLGGALAAGQSVFLTASGTVSLNAGGSIAASANAGSGGEVRLVSGTGVSQSATAPVTAEKLLADGGDGSVLMNSATNMVGTLAGAAKGDFLFQNGQSLTIGTVGGVSGITVDNTVNNTTFSYNTANIDINLTSGDLTVDQQLKAFGRVQPGVSDATIVLTAQGGITVNNNITATAGNGTDAAGAASVTMTATTGGISVNNSVISVNGANGTCCTGGAASVQLTAGGGITLNTSSISAAGGIAIGSGGSGGAASVQLQSGAGNLISLTASSISATGGAGTTGASQGSFGGPGGNASITLTSGDTITLSGVATSLNAMGGAGSNGADSSAFVSGGLGGNGGTASVSLTSVGDTTLTSATISASGGNAGSGGNGTGAGINGGAGGVGAGGSATLISGGTLSQSGGNISATGGTGGAGGTPGSGGVAGTAGAAGVGMVRLEVSTASGNGTPSGDIIADNIQADQVELQQNSLSSATGNSIKRASATSLIQADELLMEVDHGGLTSGGAIGTLTEPMRVQVSKLEAHTHETSAGIFIDSPASDLQIGGLDPAFFGGSVRGVQAVAGGDIKIRVNGVLTTLSGIAGCGATGGAGGPICATGGNIILNAEEMSFGSNLNAGTGIVTLAPFTTTRDIAMAASGETNTADNTLTLTPAQFEAITAGTLEIGRSADTGTLTVATALTPSSVLAGTLKLAHQNIAINSPIDLSASNANLMLTAGTAVALAGDLNVGTGTIDASTSTVNPTGTRSITSTNPGTGFSAATLNVGTSNMSLNATSSIDSLDLSAGSLGGTGTVTVNNTMSWSGGDLSGTGKLVVGAAATLAVSGGADRFITNGYDLDNLGTVNLTHSGTVFVNGTPTTFVTNSGAWNANQTASFGEETGGGSFRFINDSSGTVNRTTPGTGTILNVQNDGALNAQAGTLVIDNRGGFNSGGTFSIDAGATLRFVNGAHTVNGSFLAGSGAGTLDLSSTTLNIGTGVSVSIDDSLQVPSGATFNANAGASASLANVTLSGGTLGGAGDIGANGAFGWTAGTITGSGTATIGATGTLTVSGPSAKVLSGGRTLDIAGIAQWQGGAAVDTQNATINVLSGGLFDVQADGRFLDATNAGGAPNTIHVQSGGTLRKSAGGGLSEQFGSAVAQSLNNDGTIEVQVGTLQIAGSSHSGTFNVSPGAFFNFHGGANALQDGATFTGGGEIGFVSGAGGSLSLAGTGSGATLASGTTLTLTGVAVGGSGKLTNQGTLALDGTTISGTLVNEGTLNLDGGTLSLANGATHTGTFNVASGATLAFGGGTHDLTSGAVSGPAGTVSVPGGTVNIGAATSYAVQNTNVSGGSINFNTNPATATTGTLTISSGSVGGTGNLSVATDFIQTGGTFGTTFNNLSITQATGNLNAGGFGASNSLSLTATTGSINVNAPVSAAGSILLDAQGASADVTIASNISKTSGADATLEVRAGRDVLVGSGVAISSSSNKLNVILNSDRDGTGGGRIALASGSSITSNGGNVTLGGGADPLNNPAVGGTSPVGVTLGNATIDAASGNISMRGQGAQGTSTSTFSAVDIIGVVQTTSGNITVTGVGGAGSVTDTSRSYGVRIRGATTLVSTDDGAINITGTGGSSTNPNPVLFGQRGIVVESDPTIRATNTGTVALTGFGGSGVDGTINSGIYLSQGTIRTADGNLTLTGHGGSSSGVEQMNSGNYGLSLFGSTGSLIETTGAGSINITGFGGTSSNSSGGNLGVNTLGALTIRTLNGGSISIQGIGGNTTGVGAGNGSTNDGVNLFSTAIQATQTGTITISGQAGTSVNPVLARGILIQGGTSVSSDAGLLHLTATGDLLVTGGSISIATTTGNQKLEATGGLTLAADGGTITVGSGGTQLLQAGGDLLVRAQTGVTANPGESTTVSSTGNQTINAGGDFTVLGGSFTGATASVTSAGAQSVAVGGGLTVQGGAVGGAYASLGAANGQQIDASFVEVIGQGGSASINNNTNSGNQILTTSGTNGSGEGLVVKSLGSGGAAITSSASGGLQQITVNDADFVRVIGGAGNAYLVSSGNQQITIKGSASQNSLVIGGNAAIGESHVHGANQLVTAGLAGQSGQIRIEGGVTDGKASLLISDSGTQTINTSGNLILIGGTSSGPTGAQAQLINNGSGLQSIAADGISLSGGSGSGVSGGYAVLQTNASNSGGQSITVGAGGISLTGGSGTGGSNGAGINHTGSSGTQTITVNAGDVALLGGTGASTNGASIFNAGTAQVVNVNDASSVSVIARIGSAGIVSSGSQTLTLQGAASANGLTIGDAASVGSPGTELEFAL